MQFDSPQPAWREPATNPLRTLSASRDVWFSGIDARRLEMLTAAFQIAEVGLCGYSAEISVNAMLETAIQVERQKIILGESAFHDKTLLHLHLRHAIELILWFQLCEKKTGEITSVVIALLAAFTATKFYLQMPRREREAVADFLPEWLKESAEAAEMLSDKDVLETIAQHLDTLLTLQGSVFNTHLPIEDGLKIAGQYSAVANPSEFILTQQGDERLLIDPSTGLNRYGCSPRPRPDAITFSSCTASSVSEFAYRSAEMLRQRLMQTLPEGNLRAQYDVEFENARNGLCEVLDLEAQQTDVVLTSSGTDAELYPLFFIRSHPEERLVNLIVAPDEVGTGTVLAAGGRHFSSHSPLGIALSQGQPVKGLYAEKIEVACIPIRHSDGSRFTTRELNQHILAAVENAAKAADKVILHIVDNTKTGVVGPDVDFVQSLQKQFGAKLQIVVDACQFRLEKTNLHRYLECGFCVLITGSKFFTGPPFCGALLIPRKIIQESKSKRFPAGFVEYFTQNEMPHSLRASAEILSPEMNSGLLFRWAGALTEMRFFYSVPSEQRTEILQNFRSRLINSIAANPDLHLLECPEPHRWTDCDHSLWDAQPTIFSFAVRDPMRAGAGGLGIRDLKRIYVLLNRDCSSALPESASQTERQLAKQKCHIGQPVTVSHSTRHGESGALRIACGARLVYGISYDASLGNDPQERFARELVDAQTVLQKISLIVKFWKRFRSDDLMIH